MLVNFSRTVNTVANIVGDRGVTSKWGAEPTQWERPAVFCSQQSPHEFEVELNAPWIAANFECGFAVETVFL